MEPKYRIKPIICENGERFPFMIKHEDGMPMFYPNVYLVALVRNAGRQTATMEAHLRGIKFLYEWGRKVGIDVEKRFQAGDFLTVDEIDNLTNEVRIRADHLLDEVGEKLDVSTSRAKVAKKEVYRKAPVNLDAESVKGRTAGLRFTYIRNYLEWLGQRTLGRLRAKSPEYPGVCKSLELMLKNIKTRIPAVEIFQDPTNTKMGLERKTEDRLFEIVDPKFPGNPWRDERLRTRNQLLIHMQFGLGVRRGEELGIRVEDIDFAKNILTVHRCPDDPKDPRLHQPLAKTLARELPLNEKLAQLCRDYIVKYRSKNLPNARRHPFLFVETRDGMPLSDSSVTKLFKTLRNKFPELPGYLTHHVGRYTWNDRFSEQADEKLKNGEWNHEKEVDIRTSRMGWKKNSKMPAHYRNRQGFRQHNGSGEPDGART